MLGVAGALLVFTGIWHAFEWAMARRNRDTLRLVPVGCVYLVLGCLIATLQFLPWTAWIALAVTATGMIAAFMVRNTARIRTWVLWTFIGVDALIIAALLAGLLA